MSKKSIFEMGEQEKKERERREAEEAGGALKAEEEGEEQQGSNWLLCARSRMPMQVDWLTSQQILR
eukprot:SAG22_NODE_669_length_7994_cov_2.526536_1_plen_65_part_10